jgi:hypothetical protein
MGVRFPQARPSATRSATVDDESALGHERIVANFPQSGRSSLEFDASGRVCRTNRWLGPQVQISRDTFCAILAALCLASCISGLVVTRPLKSWPATRWIDHSNAWIRAGSRAGLLVACILLPLSFTWLVVGVTTYFLDGWLERKVLVAFVQETILLLPLVLAYLLYRHFAKHVRARIQVGVNEA